MIQFKNVVSSYDGVTPILKDVSFTIDDGDFVAFVGTNGAGKSTTMRLCNGLLKPDSGEVLIDGMPTTRLRTSELARRVGFLFQNPDRQICCGTVKEELLFGFTAQGGVTPEAEERVDAIIREFGFDPEAEPYLLNRGTRQLLALASIIVMETPVIILDEPTTGLDYRECMKVMEVIERLHKQGTTVIMVCHDMEIVADFAERVIVMTGGEVIDQGPTFQIMRNSETMRAADLIPAQITDISMRLAEQLPSLASDALADANTVDEMVAALEAASRKGGVA
ncbi:MAG: ABC transporter ATP-binding protein [Coriobacteriaceae bacterium]|nr:ABC transporter ATP-binding protein [Coriobacteriaceae bacterium]